MSNLNYTPTAEEIASRYPTARRSGSGWKIPCPAHDGEDPNCYIGDGDDGGLVAHCHSRGCGWADIIDALGIPRSQASGNKGNERHYMVSYKHRDGKDRHVYRRDTEKGKSIWGKGTVPGTMLLAWGIDAPAKTLVLVEGEKAAAAFQRAGIEGYTAVTWRDGARSVHHADYSLCKNRTVLLWPDNDSEGLKAMETAGNLAAAAGAESVAMLSVDDLPDKADAADLDPDAIAERLTRLVDGWRPSPAEPQSGASATSTMGLKLWEKDQTIALAVQDVSESGKFLSLGGDWWTWTGKRWRMTFPYNVTDALSAAAVRAVGLELDRAAAGEALERLGRATRAQTGCAPTITPEDMTRSFQLDTGEVIEGAIFDDELVMLNGQDVQRRRVTRNDFVRGDRGYTLPDTRKLKDIPLFRNYLRTSLGDTSADAIRLLVEYIGRILLGYMDDQKFLVLLGPGGSGKGTFIRLAELLVGKDQHIAVSQPQELGQRFQASKLVGKSLLTIGDIAQKPRAGQLRDQYLQGVGVIKAITGQDSITIEEKGKPPSAGRLDISVLCASNHPPEFLTSGADASAWQRRMMIVELPHAVPVTKRQEGLAEAIFEKEGPAIAAAAIAQFIHARNNGGYTIPVRSQQIMAQLMADAESLAERFVSEQLEFGEGRIEKKTLTERLFNWAESEGAKATAVDRNALYKELRARGCNEGKGGKANTPPYFDGVRFVR